MQGGMNPAMRFADPLEPTEVEKAGTAYDCGAVPSGAVVLGDTVAAGFGDGVLRLFRPGRDPQALRAHLGAILSMAADPSGDFVLTGGDDGRFVRTDATGETEEVEGFGSKWVDAVAVTPGGGMACSVGKTVHLWDSGGHHHSLDHPSTVGGLAFDPKGERLAVGHYGGVTLWTKARRGWKPSALKWAGSHLGVRFSPDGKYVVSIMQENALHGWRLRGKTNMRMSGYPAKVKSMDWVGSAPHLVTSGADTAICWPFDGKDGPMGRGPLMVAGRGKALATAVAGLPGHDAVVAGYKDGSILYSELDESAEPLLISRRGGEAITCLAVTPNTGWLFAAAEDGRVLWAPLDGEGA
jgi:WD40 repeat protein